MVNVAWKALHAAIVVHWFHKARAVPQVEHEGEPASESDIDMEKKMATSVPTQQAMYT